MDTLDLDRMYKLSNYKFRPYGGGMPEIVEPKPKKKEKSWFLLVLSKLTT